MSREKFKVFRSQKKKKVLDLHGTITNSNFSHSGHSGNTKASLTEFLANSCKPPITYNTMRRT